MPHPSSATTPGKPNQWLRLAALIAIVGIAIYSAWQRQQEQEQAPNSVPPHAEQASALPGTASDDRQQLPHEEVNQTQDKSIVGRTRIAQQTIRDENGRVAFRGTVDVGPTLARISRGERLGFKHDGVVFQNRERRLPQKPAAYYREYVHPTPGLDGPGPQRIIRGQNGETYYTPDHYRTFQRLDE